MNKKLMLAAGLMTLTASFADAGSCSSSASTCNTTAVADETADDFASKLSQDHAIAFNEMNSDERLEVLTSAEKENLTPDAAVDQFVNTHQLEANEGEVKTSEAH